MDFTGVTRAIGSASLIIKKNSPTILFVAGLVGVGTGTVLASKATLGLDKVLNESLQNLEDIREMGELEKAGNLPDDFEHVTLVKARMLVMADLGFKLGKAYAPAIIATGLGVACLTKSHTMLLQRNAALTAAYVALEKSYTAYRRRIAEQYGEDTERQFHREVQRDLYQKEEAAKKDDKILFLSSQYSKMFDYSNSNWTRSPEQNVYFIGQAQRYANDKLHRQGHLFLNEAYDYLGLPRTKAGSVVGWRMQGDGDHFVDFGIFNHHTDVVYSYAMDDDGCFFLDFNVDGLIYDKLGD